jgi:predicted nucleic acid-binding protein
MADRAFLDTNVMVYAFDGDAGTKQETAQRILAEAPAEGRYVLSAQVLQEFFVVVTRKLERPVAHEDAARAVAQADAASVLAAIDRVGRLGMSLWDALIVQAAVESGCTRLLTEDLQDGQVIDGVRVENPFRE